MTQELRKDSPELIGPLMTLSKLEQYLTFQYRFSTYAGTVTFDSRSYEFSLGPFI